jgi:Kef-type K+ transport system membrane component KefB
MQSDPIAHTLLALAAILTVARVGGHFAIRLRQPPVLGELVGGVILGNIGLAFFTDLRADPTIETLARLGVILLLFQVGLESTVAQMMRVGLSSLLVATLGVIGPFALGWAVGALLLPGAGTYAHVFLGATLTATSVGITARVLKDLGCADTNEARIILGAAVIDDVQGLVILALTTGIVAAADRGVSLSNGAIVLVIAKATSFLAGALVLGSYLSPHLFSLASRLQASGVLLATGLSTCFVLAWVADQIGLAPIVGAFAAGLVLERVHYRDFSDRGEHTLDELVEPIAGFLVPVFFVLMGLRTDLRVFTDASVVGLALALIAAAVIGKQLCSLGVVTSGVDRAVVGLGMIPRGEVGLIFANIGATLVVGGIPLVTPAVFSAVVVMVVATTLITPPALAWRLRYLHELSSPVPTETSRLRP